MREQKKTLKTVESNAWQFNFTSETNSITTSTKKENEKKTILWLFEIKTSRGEA